jgi:hypothetical protein
MTFRIQRRQQWACAITVSVLLCAQPVFSQETPEPAVHWAYASFFGTGWYKITDQQSAFIANFAPRWTTGDTGWSKVADQQAVFTVRIPVTLGVAQLDFEDVSGTLDPENFSAVSTGLRADLDLPVTTRLSVRPSIQLSWGTVIGENDHAWTYRGDVRGRYTIGSGNLDWALIGAAGLVGYDGNRGADDSFSYATLGAEFAYPVGWFSSTESQTLLYWHVLYADFLNRVEVQSDLGQTVEVTNYWQAGLAFGKQDKPLRVWFLQFDRFGLAYDISPSGELRGIKFVFNSLYDP